MHKYLIIADGELMTDQKTIILKSNLVNQWVYWSYLQKDKWLKGGCVTKRSLVGGHPLPLPGGLWGSNLGQQAWMMTSEIGSPGAFCMAFRQMDRSEYLFQVVLLVWVYTAVLIYLEVGGVFCIWSVLGTSRDLCVVYFLSLSKPYRTPWVFIVSHQNGVLQLGENHQTTSNDDITSKPPTPASLASTLSQDHIGTTWHLILPSGSACVHWCLLWVSQHPAQWCWAEPSNVVHLGAD